MIKKRRVFLFHVGTWIGDMLKCIFSYFAEQQSVHLYPPPHGNSRPSKWMGSGGGGGKGGAKLSLKTIATPACKKMVKKCTSFFFHVAPKLDKLEMLWNAYKVIWQRHIRCISIRNGSRLIFRRVIISKSFYSKRFYSKGSLFCKVLSQRVGFLNFFHQKGHYSRIWNDDSSELKSSE